jgi:hypothetical protein
MRTRGQHLYERLAGQLFLGAGDVGGLADDAALICPMLAFPTTALRIEVGVELRFADDPSSEAFGQIFIPQSICRSDAGLDRMNCCIAKLPHVFD